MLGDVVDVMRVGADLKAHNGNARVRGGTGHIRWKVEEKELGGEKAGVRCVFGEGGYNGENSQPVRVQLRASFDLRVFFVRDCFHDSADGSSSVVDPSPPAGCKLGNLAQSIRECGITPFDDRDGEGKLLMNQSYT